MMPLSDDGLKIPVNLRSFRGLALVETVTPALDGLVGRSAYKRLQDALERHPGALLQEVDGVTYIYAR